MDKILEVLENRLDGHISRIVKILRQPTIFNDHPNIRICAELYIECLKQAGFHEVSLIETDGSPLVYGELNCSAPKTVLVYNFFDMLPKKNEDNVFESYVKEIEPYGKCITGRGLNTKAAGVAFINAIEGCLKVNGKLPVNLKFLVEGEEMYGSIHIPWFIENHAEKIKDVEAIFVPSIKQNSEGDVNEVALGGKGFVGYELICSGAEWGRGPMEHESHSSTKAVVDSPMWRLIEAINTLVKDSGRKIAIDGFFDDVRPLTQSEEEQFRNVSETFDEEALKKRLSVDVFYNDATSVDVLKQNLFDPTLNFEGIPLTSIDPVGVVSHEAVAKFQSRIVPNQTPERLLDNIRAHLDRRGYGDIKVKKLYGFGPGRTSIDEPIVQALLKTYNDWGITSPPIFPSATASHPVNAFNNSLGIPFINGGLGHIGNVDELDFLVIESQNKIAGLPALERFYIQILEKYAELTAL
jgi:acetylornithine deacetylase/succinyl-diaminopimelate desuccinylase-like protein